MDSNAKGNELTKIKLLYDDCKTLRFDQPPEVKSSLGK